MVDIKLSKKILKLNIDISFDENYGSY